ncbi:dihydropteroate synthase [Arcobacter sp. 31_11_sub10_T18]|nr:dihydropteroate synthase [Arcobacter sp. 31_11_sub10_T18]
MNEYDLSLKNPKISSETYKTKIMGVINANEDSFYQKSRFDEYGVIEKIQDMINDGADIVDIGAVSSRPGSLPLESKEELKRIQPLCDLIYKEKLHEKVLFSIDSYTPDVLRYTLDRGFKIVNDITGLSNDDVAKITAQYNAQIVIMHMQKSPSNMQDSPTYDDVILDIDKFFTKQIQKAQFFGIKDIVLDVGIGFGKTLEHNLTLLNNLDYYKKFSCELLVGASRKSLINNIVPSFVDDRLPGTLAIHLESLKKGASIIRCHDVKEHYQAIKIQEAILSQKRYS